MLYQIEGIEIALADKRNDRQARQRFGMGRTCPRAPSLCFGSRRVHRRCLSRTTRWPESHFACYLAFRMDHRLGMRYIHGHCSIHTALRFASQLAYRTDRCFVVRCIGHHRSARKIR